jgi:hypothetical protein
VVRYSFLKSSGIRCIAFVTIFLGILFNAAAQNNELADVLKKFNIHARNNLHEKVYLHTDKENYLSNELVWVKLYVVSEMLHKPLALSKVVYIEILDVANVPALQSKIELSNGKGNGSLDISRLATGQYRIRAYTRWMMNSDDTYFYEKTIRIINAQGVPTEKKETKLSAITADFFPEGGNLVDGLTSTVGFKIADAFGNGLPATGVVVNQNNDTIARFEPLRAGLGKFRLTPQKGTQYKAVILHNGITSIHNLPEVYANGYVMSVDSKGGDKLSITISRNNPAVESDYVLLLAHTRQQVKSLLVAYFKENKAVFTIDKNKLGEGVSHITIFDRLKNPVCERLVFKRPANQLEIESKPQTYQFATREQVKVSIITRDSKTSPVSANLSFSMYALDSLQQPPQHAGILSYFFLAADLSGKVEDADYYFTQDSIANKAADNLMLTHGWRKFDWKKILNEGNPAITYAPEYEGHIISGIARDEATGMLADSSNVFLSVAGKAPLFRAVKTDEKGNFQFSVNDMYGSNPVIFQASGYGVSLRDPFDSRYHYLALKDFSPDKATEQTLTVSNIHTQVERAFQNFENYKTYTTDTTRFYSKPSISYLLDDYVRFPTLEDVFREYVPGVIIRKPTKTPQIYILNKANQLFFEREPLILLDGMPVTNTQMLLSTDASTIKQISMVNERYFFGPVTYDGIMDIRTYRGNLGSFDIDPKAVVIDYDGLQKVRIFNSPEYATAESKTSRVPDFRNVLYWQPDVDTDNNGSQVITFYTSDKRGNFVGVIHGMTKDGLMGSRTFTINVK